MEGVERPCSGWPVTPDWLILISGSSIGEGEKLLSVSRHFLFSSLLVPVLIGLALACGPSYDQEERSGQPGDTGTEMVEAEGEEPTDVRPDSVRAVYVPDYSHIYHGGDRTRFPLTTTLSVRNTDPGRSITITSVRYYDTDGQLTRRFLKQALRLEPLGTAEFVLAEHDISGGTGANFIVEWTTSRSVSRPVIEAVMIGTRSGQGISFTSRGQPIERTVP